MAQRGRLDGAERTRAAQNESGICALGGLCTWLDWIRDESPLLIGVLWEGMTGLFLESRFGKGCEKGVNCSKLAMLQLIDEVPVPGREGRVYMKDYTIFNGGGLVSNGEECWCSPRH